MLRRRRVSALRRCGRRGPKTRAQVSHERVGAGERGSEGESVCVGGGRWGGASRLLLLRSELSPLARS
eukprot:6175193-Pleurochrysis_carterae.AAC.6